MRYFIPLMLVAGCCLGCSESGELKALKASLQVTGEEVVAKQDQSIEILKANTDALTAIKAAVENLSQQPASQPDQQIINTLGDMHKLQKEIVDKLIETRQALKPIPQLEPLPAPKTTVVVAEPIFAPVRITATKAKLRWNVNGNWSPTITETATHLRAEHGVSIDGLNEQQLHDLHADIHEGKSGGQPVGAIFPRQTASAVTSQRIDFRPAAWGSNFISRAKYSTRQSCPSGRCPRR